MSKLQGNKERKESLSLRQNPCNSLKESELQGFFKNTGTQSGQTEITLYDTLEELCKEKKMSKFFKPTPYIDYIPPRLTEGQEWYISYSVKDPETGRMKRFRHKINRIKSVKERRAAAKIIIGQLTEKLSLGWNPTMGRNAPKSSSTLIEAMDTFLVIKKKETEENSFRSYRSYIKILKAWLKEYEYPDSLYACAFTESDAMDFMNDVDDDERLSPRTFNNYRAFYVLFFNWAEEKGYVNKNPFVNIKKKPKKLTKKIRRPLTDDEIHRLVEFLSEENLQYLRMCLLCYCCFMRPKEISMLRISDIDLKSQTVKVSEDIAKNDKTSFRTIPDVMMPYMAGLDAYAQSNYVFADGKGYDFLPGRKKMCSRKIAKYWDHVRTACDFPMEVQFYSLKDTGITNMLSSGVPVSFVKQQADHSSLAVTSIYVQMPGKASEELKEVDIIHG